MTHIESNNRMVANRIQTSLDQLADGEKPNKFIQDFMDFDSSVFTLICKDRENITIRLSVPHWDSLGGDDLIPFLDQIYSNTLATKAENESNSNIAYTINIQQLAEADENARENTIRELSRMRRNCWAGVFNSHFEAHKAGNAVTKSVVRFRADETMFIKANAEHVVVIFSICFKDPDDQVLAKIFMNEFADAKLGPGHNPPNVILTRDPPGEIANEESAYTGEHVYYLTFVLQRAHIVPQAKADNTVDLIHNFRTYLHYHIKCSKAYIHQRMRSKTEEFRQILNRAKPEHTSWPGAAVWGDLRKNLLA